MATCARSPRPDRAGYCRPRRACASRRLRATVADLLHDESRLAASGVASVAEPGTAGGAAPGDALARRRGASRDRERRPHRGHRRRRARRVHAPGVGGTPARRRRLSTCRRTRPSCARWPAPRCASCKASSPRAPAAGRCHSTRPRPARRWAGMVATNAAGSRCFRFGATRDWVVGLTVELASGRTLELRRGADRAEGDAVTLAGRRRASAPRICRRFPSRTPRTPSATASRPAATSSTSSSAAKARLGVVSEVTLRLTPATESRLAFLQCFATPAQAFALVEALRARHRRCAPPRSSSSTPARTSWRARPASPRWSACWPTHPRAAARCSPSSATTTRPGSRPLIERVLAHVAAAGGDEAAGLAGIDDQVLRDIRVFRHAVPERINATIARRRERAPHAPQDRHRHGGGGQGPALGLRALHHAPHRGRARPCDLRPCR